MQATSMKLTVTFSEADVKRILIEAVEKEFPTRRIGEATIVVSPGYDDGPGRGQSFPSLSKVTIDVFEK